jgi:predicted SAM-dependent methyltransferase/DNA-directed RNA polymerase subunit RPC12/RpoP
VPYRQQLRGVAKTVFTATVPPRLRPHVVGAYRPLLHRGDRYECPLCGGRFGSLESYEGVPDVRCPRCASMERHRLLWRWISRSTDLLSRPQRVLHLAPEWSLQRRLRRMEHLDYTSADLDSPLADEHFDVTAIPHPDASFDVVLCNHVLEHVDDDRAALRELRRVLRPGRWAVLMVPIGIGRDDTLEDPAVTTPEQRTAVYGQFDHVRLYGRRDYLERLREAGFDAEEIDELAVTPEEEIERRQLRRKDGVFEPDTIFVGR